MHVLADLTWKFVDLKVTVIVFRRLILIFGLQLIYFGLFAQEPSITAQQGWLDLRSWDFNAQGTIPIFGEYEFYWKQLYEPEDFDQGVVTAPTYYDVPSFWNEMVIGDSIIGKYGYATLRLQILLPASAVGKNLSFRIPTTSTSTLLYCNNQLIYQLGTVSADPDQTIPSYRPGIADIPFASDTLEIVVQQANYYHRRAGLWNPFKLGLEPQVRKARRRSLLVEAFLAGCMLIMSIYHFGFYYLRRKDSSTLYFGLACLALFFRILATGEYQFGHFISDSWFVIVRVEYLSMMTLGAFLMLFFDRLFDKESYPILTKGIVGLAALFSVIILFTPPKVFTYTYYGFHLMLLMTIINFSKILISAVYKKREGALAF
ncbi:MAG: 7TM-DISM domain-containing protein, partial [Flammeovirgaceae bacterium]